MKAHQQVDGSYTVYDGSRYVRGQLCRSEAEFWLEGWSYALESREGIGPSYEIVDNKNEPEI